MTHVLAESPQPSRASPDWLSSRDCWVYIGVCLWLPWSCGTLRVWTISYIVGNFFSLRHRNMVISFHRKPKSLFSCSTYFSFRLTLSSHFDVGINLSIEWRGISRWRQSCQSRLFSIFRCYFPQGGITSHTRVFRGFGTSCHDLTCARYHMQFCGDIHFTLNMYPLLRWCRAFVTSTKTSHLR